MAAGLTEKQRRFVEEYLVDANATKAAARAGYSEKSAGATGCGLLKKPSVQEELRRRQGEVSRKLQVRFEEIVKELSVMATANVLDYVDVVEGNVVLKDPKDMDRERWAAVASAKNGTRGAEIRLADKLAAIKLLCEYLGYPEGAAAEDGIRVVFEAEENYAE